MHFSSLISLLRRTTKFLQAVTALLPGVGVENADWLTALRTLEEQGVGERRREGFGEVRVCDDFHGRIQEVQR